MSSWVVWTIVSFIFKNPRQCFNTFMSLANIFRRMRNYKRYFPQNSSRNFEVNEYFY